MSEFKVITAMIGVIKGTHKQFVRPAQISASQTDIDRAFETTRGFSNLNANTIGRSNLTNMTIDTSCTAPLRSSNWADTRSHGVLIVDREVKGAVERYNLKFYVEKSAIINDRVNPMATLYFDSSTKVILKSNGLARAQTDIIQRLSGKGTIIGPNRVSDRLHATHSADGMSAHIGAGHDAMKRLTTLGDSSNLLADDSLAASLSALSKSARTLGGRSRSMIEKESVRLETICDGAQEFIRETTNNDNELISFIVDGGGGSDKYLSIQLDKLQSALGEFDFAVVKTEAGDMDFTKTSEMTSITGATAQYVANDVIGLMVRNDIVNLRFFATNSNGPIEMVCGDNWLVPVATDKIDGLDKEAYIQQLYQKEATIRAEIEALILPKVMNRGNTEMIVDISMLTIASIVISVSGTKERFCLQTATLSGWSSINISEQQLGNSGTAHKALLNAINTTLDNQAQPHL